MEYWLDAEGTDGTDSSKIMVVFEDGRRVPLSEFDEGSHNAVKDTVKALAQSAVGVAINELTTAQRWALLAALLWKVGAIGPDMKIRPLKEWVK